MRQAYSQQLRLDCQAVPNVKLNLNCRHELIPVLRALQHVYQHAELRDQMLALVAQDVNRDSVDDRGRKGLDYWTILVLAAVRLGCGLDYDQLQDLAENHRVLRQIMGIGDWDEATSFHWSRLRSNVSLVSTETLDQINQLVVAAGHRLVPDAAEHVRADSFVVETDIHWPSESTLIRDGVRKMIEIGVLLQERLGIGNWRQQEHLLKKVKDLSLKIERIASKKGPGYKKRLRKEYETLLEFSGRITTRVRKLLAAIEEQGLGEQGLGDDVTVMCHVGNLRMFLQRTEQVRNTARRRVLREEEVPNEDKLFSMFEPHTQLYKRGKAGEPIQFGRLVLVYEDAAGFIVHHHVMSRDAQDADVLESQTRELQSRLGGRVKRLSYDRGFHSPTNQKILSELVDGPCLPKKGAQQGRRQYEESDEEFRQSRRRHAGVESAIGALQRGNDLERCRDRGEAGFGRYVGLGVLGRNLFVLGKHLIAAESPESAAAISKRQAA